MARVKYQREVVQNFQIEDGIRRTLRQSSRAAVSASVIDTSYELEDDEFMPIEGTFDEKCQAISEKLGAQYRMSGENVIFEKRSER